MIDIDMYFGIFVLIGVILWGILLAIVVPARLIYQVMGVEDVLKEVKNYHKRLR